MLYTFHQKIWLYPSPVDFRKQIDGLVVLVSDQLDLNPTSGELFLFRDRLGKKLKILWWDSNGFWLFYKRLEKGKLQFPKPGAETLFLSRDQFYWLLSGLDYTNQQGNPVVQAKHFY